MLRPFDKLALDTKIYTLPRVSGRKLPFVNTIPPDVLVFLAYNVIFRTGPKMI